MFYCSTEGGRLSQPRYWNTYVQPMPKVIVINATAYSRIYIVYFYSLCLPEIILLLPECCQTSSSMRHYECAALCKDISLQRGRFCTRSLASCIQRSSEDRSPWMFFIQDVHSHSGGRLQFSERGWRFLRSECFAVNKFSHFSLTSLCLTVMMLRRRLCITCMS